MRVLPACRWRVPILALVAIALGGAAGGAATAVSAVAQTCGEVRTVSAAADSWIDQNSSANNFGSDSILKVRAKSQSNNFRALVRFALPATVPSGCVVESATLRLYASSAAPGSSLEVARLASGWTENGVTWGNQPAVTGAASTVFAEDGYLEWPVAAQVQAMYDAGANHGFLIRDAAEGGDGGEQAFHAREKGETPPQLVLQFGIPAPPSSEPAAPTRAVVGCGQVLTQSTLVDNDVSECPGDGLIIGADRIILDLNGHTIDGVGLGAGIRNSGFDSVIIRNGTVQDFDYGVWLRSGTADNIVEGLALELHQLAGIELMNAGDGNLIQTNTLTSNHHGIALVLDTSGTAVLDNTISLSGGTGLVVEDSSGNRLEGNRVSGGGDIGIGLTRSSGNTLAANAVSSNSDGGIDLVEGSNGNRVEGNVITQSGDAGLVVNASDGNVLIANVSQEMSDSGISLSAANDSVVQGNDVRFNPGGLQVDGSSRNLLQANDASNSTGIGIELGSGSLANWIVLNTANENGAQGIYLSDDAPDGLGNLVLRNTANENGSDGIATGKGGHIITANTARANGGLGFNAFLGTIDGGGNVASGNLKPEQCLGLACGGASPPPTGSTPPDTGIGSRPAASTASASAIFTFFADQPSTAFACSLDGGAFAACGVPAEYTGLAEGDHRLDVRATNASGRTDESPASYAWIVDQTPPETTFQAGPDAATSETVATLAFSAADSVTPASQLAFECSLDGAEFLACVSPIEFTGLAVGAHELRVIARDAAGNTGPEPASYGWTIDLVPPEATIEAGPNASTTDTTATFRFSANEDVTTFACSLDGAAFAACDSPRGYTNLAAGDHRFEVRARDAAGNESAPVSRAWTVTVPVDTTPPDTTILSGPPATTASTSATFTFSASEPGATLQCSLNSGPFAPCTSPVTYTVAAGTHGFRVQARDAAGNVDQTPASYSWTVTSVVAPPTNCGAAVTVVANADAWIDQGSPSSNKGRDSILKVMSKSSGNLRALVRFQLPAVPAGCELDSATLRLFTGSARTGRTIQALQVSGGWTETGVTWGTQPSTTGAAATASSGNGYREWGVTTQVRAMSTGANNGFLIRDATEGGDAEQQFHAREKGQNPPQLVIRFKAVDTEPPETTIDFKPAATTPSPDATFTFSANEPTVTFECALDEAEFAACTSPTAYTGLAVGEHVFRVRAKDAARNTDATPARHEWTIQEPPDTTAPDTEITGRSEDPTVSGDARIIFTGSDDKTPAEALTFQCRRDGGEFTACASPHDLTGLTPGTYTVEVRAVDGAGNIDGSPASATWTVQAPVDTTPPDTTITDGPDDPTPETGATFIFVADEEGVRFECALDEGEFTPCEPGVTYSGLVADPYSFAVRAIDAAGNVEPDPATYTWTVQAPADTTPPETTIEDGPDNPTTETSATFIFSADDPSATFFCSLDGGDYVSCASGQLYEGLGVGPHSFAVLATDGVNTEQNPATHDWIITESAPAAAPVEGATEDPTPAASGVSANQLAAISTTMLSRT